MAAVALSMLGVQPGWADDDRPRSILQRRRRLPPASSLYMSEGSVIANEIVNFTGTPRAGATLTEDHGIWQKMRNGKFLVTFLKLASVNGSFIASVKTRAEVQSSGETFQGRFRVDVISPTGNLLFFVNGSIAGKRIKAEPL